MGRDDETRAGDRSWRPRVRTVLVAVVLIPASVSAALLGRSASTAWDTRHSAGVVADDARQLEEIAQARATLNQVEIPASAVAYAARFGISSSQLDGLLHPAVPFEVQLAGVERSVRATPTFVASAALRGDRQELLQLVGRMTNTSVPFDTVHALFSKTAADVDSRWARTYDEVERDLGPWRPPGSFGVQVDVLAQLYRAFVAGNHEVEAAVYVLMGTGPADARIELIRAADEFASAISGFEHHLTSRAAAVWRHIQTDDEDRQFASTVQQAVTLAISDAPPVYAGNTGFAASTLAPSLDYSVDLGRLVTGAARDLTTTARQHASAAADSFLEVLLALAVLALVGAAAVIAANRILTRPLSQLAAAARRVREGQFSLEHLDSHGPREVSSTIDAFNDMAATLVAVEGKAVALAEEDLSHAALESKLPGRTGLALQASLDRLAGRMREREQQRHLLNEAATHDALTGLLNRAAVMGHLADDVTRRRARGETVAVLFVDLDGLKRLNDRFGHDAGDAAISATAEALLRATGPCDVVGRLGGDEFLVVLCHDHSLESAAVVEDVRLAVGDSRIPTARGPMPLEASIGIALAECGPETDPVQLVRTADEAMYEAKRGARAGRRRTATTRSALSAGQVGRGSSGGPPGSTRRPHQPAGG